MPSAYFREHLCRALEKTPEELGFVQGLDEAFAPSTAPCVFLAAAYTDAERKFTTQLKAHLQARGVTVLSSRTLRRQGGQNQSKALQEAIRAAQVLLLIASPQACSSRHVQHAMQMAGIYQCHICVVWIAGERLHECIPKDSGEFFAIFDVRQQHDRHSVAEIVKTLEGAWLASNETAKVAYPTPGPADSILEQDLGNYQLIQLIEQGHWASVYLGEHRHLHTQVAIKILHAPLADTEMQDYLSEARTLARLRHPHIVRVLDFGVQEDTPFLVMEYAPGGNLRQLHPRGTRLPLSTVVSYVKQVAEALQYAHEQRLIHRNLKPENLLLGPEQEIWLSDFGLANLAHSARSQSFQQTANIMASMVPEQLEGHPAPASDQYAMGVLVYEWLAGERPFSESVTKPTVKQVLAPPPSLSEKEPTLPVQVDQVVQKALAKDPNERFASVQAFALALEEAMRGESSGRTLDIKSIDDSAGSSFKNNLPVQMTTLLGRELDVKMACALLRRPEVHLLTLTGAGGIGKTRLSLQIATDLLEDFTDGVFFAPLAAISDPALVMPTIAQVFGLQERGDQPLLNKLKAYLRAKRLLLLLDNFEQILQAAAGLAELLAVCPQLKIMVTSRAPLHLQGEHEFAIPPLAVPELAHLSESEILSQYAAVALFLQRAQAIKHDFQLTKANARAIVEMCARLDGLPLAIELAAARIKLLPPQALLARLEHRLQVLTGGAQTMPVRQQTLRNTIAWSYNLLDVREQQLFRLLSVFVGGCSIEAIEAVWGALNNSEEAVSMLDDIASLIDKSLVQQTEQEGWEPRLRMLETIREYGLEALTAAGEREVAHQAHADYFLNLAEEGEPHSGGPKEALRWDRLEHEHDNLRAAMQWALAQAEASDSRYYMEIALRLGVALVVFWHVRAHLSEGRNALKRGLARSEGVAPLLRAKALEAAGMLAYFLNETDQVEVLCGESLALSRKFGDKVGMAFSLFWLGRVPENRGDLAQARRMLEEALTLFKEIDHREFVGYSYGRLAGILTVQGEYTRATTLLEEMLAIQRGIGNTYGVASSLNRLVKVLFVTGGNPARMRTLAEEAYALATELGGPGRIGLSMLPLAEAALAEGDTARARLLLEEALVIVKESDERLAAWILLLLGKVAVLQGDNVVASTLYQKALPLGDRHDLPFYLEGLADVATKQGEPRWAAQLWGAAESLREAMGTPIPPIWRADYEHSVAAARTQLVEKAFVAAWEEGRSMTVEQVLAAQGRKLVPTATPIPLDAISASLAKFPITYSAGLTAREVEVLRLVAQGLTNEQVAKQLVISPRTVNTHLTSIYGKIDVSSRAAITHYAIEHHLI
jgi:predicted ATPase/DNA-binding CsgD family transcriptional regulator/tRNA A-37 threonylcarbamoyl transferase component Bud32